MCAPALSVPLRCVLVMYLKQIIPLKSYIGDQQCSIFHDASLSDVCIRSLRGYEGVKVAISDIYRGKLAHLILLGSVSQSATTGIKVVRVYRAFFFEIIAVVQGIQLQLKYTPHTPYSNDFACFLFCLTVLDIIVSLSNYKLTLKFQVTQKYIQVHKSQHKNKTTITNGFDIITGCFFIFIIYFFQKYSCLCQKWNFINYTTTHTAALNL